MELDNELINHFLTGTIAVFALVLIGGTLAHILRSVGAKFLFTKAALVLALPPLALSQCVDRSSLDTLYLFAFILILPGFLIDGARHLVCAWKDGDTGAPPKPSMTDTASEEKGLVWEKVG
jgi:hypothetical protein